MMKIVEVAYRVMSERLLGRYGSSAANEYGAGEDRSTSSTRYIRHIDLTRPARTVPYGVQVLPADPAKKAVSILKST